MMVANLLSFFHFFYIFFVDIRKGVLIYYRRVLSFFLFSNISLLNTHFVTNISLEVFLICCTDLNPF